MLLLAYKLYSATTMVQDQVNLVNGGLPEDLPPANWAAAPGVWTDLNEPIELKVDGLAQKIFPILDPKASTDLGVEGFVLRGLAEKLPVRWLYVLKDGALNAPTEVGGKVKVDGASENNPIVGRIAFWANDETSKINVNTAGIGKTETSNTTNPTINGGSLELYWDIPRFVTSFDLNLLANAQPAATNLPAILVTPHGRRHGTGDRLRTGEWRVKKNDNFRLTIFHRLVKLVLLVKLHINQPSKKYFPYEKLAQNQLGACFRFRACTHGPSRHAHTRSNGFQYNRLGPNSSHHHYDV